jgi:hypothetical protein
VSDFSVDGKARCPHCGTAVQFAKGTTDALQTPFYGTHYAIRWVECPSCGNLIITLIYQEKGEDPVETTLYPLSTQRTPVANDVPPNVKSDYEEAALVLSFSPKGSAALSRGCLQEVLQDAGKVT